MSGLGNRLNRPSLSIRNAPSPRSSEGWPTSITVPAHCGLLAARNCATPIRFVMWMSWPQACITPVVEPSVFLTFTREA